MNSEAFDKAGRIANIFIIVLAVISIFIEPSVGIGMLIGALMRKNNLAIGDKTGSFLTITFIIALGIALYFLIDALAVIGYAVAIGAYFLVKFFTYYILDRPSN